MYSSNKPQLNVKQSGVVLVFVLVMVVLLTVMAGGFSYSMRSDATQVHTMKIRLKNIALLDAAITYAKYMLTEPDASKRWTTDARQYVVKFKGMNIQITLQDEGGKFDLNRVDEAMLLSLLSSVTEADDKAQQLADTILDWRDTDDEQREFGYEGESSGDNKPPNRFFRSINELRSVEGMTESIYQQLAPLVTVLTKQKQLDISVASKNALLALPGSTEDWVQYVLASRSVDPKVVVNFIIPDSMNSYAKSSTGVRGRFLEITAKLKQSQKYVFSKQLIVSRNVRGFYPAFTNIEMNVGR